MEHDTQTQERTPTAGHAGSRSRRQLGNRGLFWAARVAALALLLPLSAPLHRVWAQGNTAIVTGAERVYVRRGPGTEFPPFGTLPQGTKVEVQEMTGEWSRVVTPRGEVGYMHSNFLAPEGEASRRAAETPSAGAAPAGADAAALAALTERNKSLEAQLSALQEELSAAKSRASEPPPAPATPALAPDAEALHAQLERLATAVEAIDRRLDDGAGRGGATASTPLQGKPPMVSPTAWLLGGFGLLVGWLLGAAYGRNQERGRRSRIRF